MDSDPNSKNDMNKPPDDLDDIPMVNDDLREHVGNSYDAREVIAAALWEKTFFDYAVHRGQIEIKNVAPKIRSSQAFQQFIGEFGWPNAKDDNGIELPHLYESEDEPDYDAFLDAFLSRSKDSQGQDDRAANLDNFRLWLIVEPSEEPLSLDYIGVEQQYATHPALHRLYAIMPELMFAVRTLVKDMYERNPDAAAFATEMSADVNAEVVKAIYLIYQVAGRLLKANDRQLHRKILQLPSKEPTSKITDAHQELRA